MSIEEEIIVYAVRYAVGRMSYAVHNVSEYVASQKDSLSNLCKRAIIRDILSTIEDYHAVGRTCGMEIDERCWLRLVEVLKE